MDQADFLTRAEIERLRDELTMLDVFQARKDKDPNERGLRAFFHAAVRLGIEPDGGTLEGFLVRIRTSDFNEVMTAADTVGRIPLARPESGGESAPISSDGTDSGPETS